ncbi:UDP-N-acetylmuramate--L-alanine ligase [Abyssisolibacter fermentans]|uniref:UDP-N-acetylmuramate--L-alanine ligase n=1 Tax=Abyssisolibacter fermentans TaxID=1766203 RepID=UPI003B835F24
MTFTKPNTKLKHIHFIGIGGISMSGLAEICLNNGYIVSGSDMKSSLIIKKLEKKGARIYISHDRKNIEKADLVIYTSAIKDDNPELIEAKKRKIETVDRATFLGNLMKDYKQSISVSGTHGKTTTTGMLATILQDSNDDPTILLGGNLDSIGGNIKIGSNNVLLTEACEYKGNFLKFYPTIEVILNIDKDHMDYFTSIEHIIDTFKKFTDLIPINGTLVINGDDHNCKKLFEKFKCDFVTFGIDNTCNYSAKDIETNGNSISYMLTINNKIKRHVKLNVIGKHNVYNSLAAIASAHIYGLDLDYIISSISNFYGTERRFQYKGIVNNMTIIDDYGHHPTAIKATLSSTSKLNHNHLWCVFQPHTYSRTYELLDDFSNAFYDCDFVIITDIYAARENDTGIVHSKDLVEKLKANGINATYIQDFNDISSYILSNGSQNDIVITMGAGDIYEVGNKLIQ